MSRDLIGPGTSAGPLVDKLKVAIPGFSPAKSLPKWIGALRGLPMAQCLAAIDRQQAEDGGPPDPGAIAAAVRQDRHARIHRARQHYGGYPVPPPGLDDTPPGKYPYVTTAGELRELAWLTAWADAVMDGDPDPLGAACHAVGLGRNAADAQPAERPPAPLSESLLAEAHRIAGAESFTKSSQK